jgi:hypothetical protein
MKLAFNGIRVALLALVAVSLGIWGVRTFLSAQAAGGGDALPPDGVVVVNFHGATRCDACREIGTAAQTVVESRFGEEFQSGRLIWRVINFDEPGHRHFIQDYGLTTSTVVVVRRKGGRDVDWRRLDGVWDHLFQAPAMHAYLTESIGELTVP